MSSHRLGCIVLAVVIVSPLLTNSPAGAQPQGNAPAALIVYPRVETRSSLSTDTELYLATSRAGTTPTSVYCVYTSGVGHCSDTGQPCSTALSCLPLGQACVPACTTSNFTVTLSPRQIIEWQAGVGLDSLPTPVIQTVPPSGGSIPPVPTDPFIGDLRCVELDEQGRPAAGDNLMGTAVVLGPQFSAASYEAIAVRSTGTNDGDSELCLGANTSGDCTTAEYTACPDELTINHFFEGADTAGGTVQNHLALVPCTAFDVPRPGKPSPDRVSVDLTLTVVNEFEQQTVAPLTVTCFADLALSGIPAFSAAAQGTLAGQTFVHSAQSDADAGPGVLGVMEQTFVDGASSSASAHGLTSLGTAGRADPIALMGF